MKRRTWFKAITNPETDLSHINELLRIADTNIINSVDKSGRTGLMAAMLSSQLSVVIELLLDNGVDTTVADIEGMTALHYAVESYPVPIIEKLLESGANINAKNNKEETPLLLAAAKSSDLDVIKLLFDRGADLNAKNNHDAGVALYAVTNKKVDCLDYLEQAGVDFSCVDSFGRNSLHMAIKHDLPLERISRFIALPLNNTGKFTSKKLKKDIEYNEYKSTISSAIILAAIYSSDPEVIKLLIQSGADIEQRDPVFAWTPLMHAVSNQQKPNIVSTLLAEGAQIDAQDPDGMTPLMLAARYNDSAELYELLLNSHADTTMTNKEGTTAEQIALDNDSYEFKDYFKNIAYEKEVKILYDLYEDENTKEIVSSLMRRWKDEESENKDNQITPLMIAAGYEPAEVVSLLIERGADVNFESEYGNLPILYAAMNDDIECLKEILSNGGDPEANYWGEMNLLESAIVDDENVEKVRTLIEYGVNIEGDYSRTRKHRLESFVEMFDDGEDAEINYHLEYSDLSEHLVGSPAIILATILCFDEEITEVLLKAGADINSKDFTFGKTPLIWALEFNEQFGRKDIERFLSLGADVNACDDTGKTALMYAAEKHYDNSEIIALLFKAGSGTEAVFMQGFTVLMALIIWGAAIENIEILIRNGANINETNDFGNTPLHIAASWHYYEAITILVEAGASFIRNEIEDTTPLVKLFTRYFKRLENLKEKYVCFEERFASAVKTLLEHEGFNTLDDYLRTINIFEEAFNADITLTEMLKSLFVAGLEPEWKDDEENTLIHLLAGSIFGANDEDIEALKFLIEAGVDLDATNGNGETILDILASEMFDYENLYEEVFKITLKKDIEGFIRILVDSGARNGLVSVLNEAIRNDYRIELIDYLLETEVDFEQQNSQLYHTPLMVCIMSSSPQLMMENLINHGANINSRNEKGNSVLDFLYTEWDPSYELINYIISKGYDINSKNSDGETALHQALDNAEYNYDARILQLLLEAGADADVESDVGVTPRDLAQVIENEVYRDEALKLIDQYNKKY